MANYTKLQSLDWLRQVPRKLTPDVERICDEISGKPAFFVFWGGGPKGWVKDMEHARLSFVYVVQANECLFDAEESEYAPAVMLSTTDERAADESWMQQVSSELAPRLRGADFPQAAALLADENSNIDLELPSASTGGIPFRLWTTYVDPDKLPGRCVPETRILPALLHGKQWSLLPPKLYS